MKESKTEKILSYIMGSLVIGIIFYLTLLATGVL